MKKYDNSVNNLRTVDSSHMTTYTYEELSLKASRASFTGLELHSDRLNHQLNLTKASDQSAQFHL